jgi:hypothetical protein
MSPQADYVVANGTGAAVRSDINGQLAAIVSNNSGATEPATMYAYQWWADTSTGLLKLRNAANNAWITLRELDGTLTIEAGTVSAPGLAFASDLNTGVFSAGADQLAIATNGVERVEWGTSEVVFNDGGANYDFRIEGDTVDSLFFVDASTDRVGLGSSSPAEVLHLGGSSAQNIRINGNTNALYLGTVGDTTQVAVNRRPTDGTIPNSARGTAFINVNGLSTGGSIELATSTAANTGAVTAVTIDSSQRVGIGTTSPDGNLTIGGLTNTGGQSVDAINVNRTDGVRLFGVKWDVTSNEVRFSGNTKNYVFRNGSSEAETARLTSDGKFLVGTSTGNYDFQVGATGAAGVAIDKATSAIHGTFGTGGGLTLRAQLVATSGGGDIFLGGSTRGDGNVNAIVLSTANTERMRITSTGAVLAGYTSAGANGAGIINAVGYAHKQGLSSSPGGSAFNFFWTGSLQAWIDNSNVGNVTLTSDYRIKKNIQTQTSSAIPRLKQLRPVTYERANYGTLFTEDGVAREGFIAHELAEIVPSAVEGDKDAENQIQSINIDALVSVLTKALQEAVEKIETLEAKVAALEAV